MKYLLFLGSFGDQLGGWQHFEESAENTPFLKAIAENCILDWAQIVAVPEREIILYGIRKLDVKASFDEGYNKWKWEWSETPPKLWETILGRVYDNNTKD